MPKPQEVFDRMEKTREDIKALKSQMGEYYAQVSEFLEIENKLLELRGKKKIVTQRVDEENPTIIDKLSRAKMALADDKQLLADLLIGSLARGEQVHIQSSSKQMMFPIFSVKLKSE